MMTKDQIKEYKLYLGFWIRLLGHISALSDRNTAECLEFESPDDTYEEYYKVLFCIKPNGGWGSSYLQAGAYD